MKKSPVVKVDSAKYIRYGALALGIFFVGLFLRAVQLQVFQSDKYSEQANRQQTRTVSIQSKRGDIYDRNLKELAVSLEVDSVAAHTDMITSVRETAKALSSVLPLDRRDVEKRLRSRSGFVWLSRRVDLTAVQRERLASIKGIEITKESRRYYPNMTLASNLVGFTDVDSKGLEGIEWLYDKELKGEGKKIVADADGKGRVLLYEDPGKNGETSGMEVELTIDKTIQFIAEKALRKAVGEYKAKGGVVLVMDPVSGEILAMASLPSFDPNDLAAYRASNGRNKAVVEASEPGSTLKMFVMAAALEENIVKPTDSVYCENGRYKVDDRVFHDTEKHGYLTVSQVLKLSSNIGAAKIGERLGKVSLHKYLKSFGFGSKTGVDLPGESSGSMKNGRLWNRVALHTISFGQGISTTPIQLTAAISSIANGGLLMKPYVVRTIKDPSGAVVKENNPMAVRRVVSEDTARKITQMMIGVTETGGTGVKASLGGFEVAGKTGTAQKPDHKNGGYVDGAYIASFLGFVPARQPRLAILVMVDEPQREYYASEVAAPAFKEIAEESLSYLGVYRENKSLPKVQLASYGPEDGTREINTFSASDPAFQTSGAAVPDFTGATVRMAVRIANQRNLDVEIKGSGKAVAQRPAPGNAPAKGGQVTVWFQ